MISTGCPQNAAEELEERIFVLWDKQLKANQRTKEKLERLRPWTKKAHGRQDAVGSGTPARLFVIATERGHNALCAMAGNRTGNHPHPVFSLRPQKTRTHFIPSDGVNSPTPSVMT
jgi:hypothetical protein